MKTDRTRTLLDNIIAGHPKRGTNYPTKQELIDQKKRIISLHPANRK